VASGDEYRARLDDASTGGVYAIPGVIRSRDAGVRLTSAGPVIRRWSKLAQLIPDCFFVCPLFVTGDAALLQ